jgi:2-methylcitrate dehydratase
MVEAKFRTHLAHRFPERQQQAILQLCLDEERLQKMPVNTFVDLFVDLSVAR